MGHFVSLSAHPLTLQNIKEYGRLYPGKSWNFPKAHSHKHLFQDIRRKGATRNFNTKYDEKGHGPLKDAYDAQTNFKDVGPQVRLNVLNSAIYCFLMAIQQILRINELELIAVITRAAITRLNLKSRAASNEERADHDNVAQHKRTIIGTAHVSVGSVLPAETIHSIEGRSVGVLTFTGFRKKLNTAFTSFLDTNIRLPVDHQVRNII
jgi:hypothetical protein